MSDSPWNNFFEEPEATTPVDRSSIILNTPPPVDDTDLGLYSYDFNEAEAPEPPKNPFAFAGDINESSTNFTTTKTTRPLTKTERKKSKESNLAKAFNNEPDETPDMNQYPMADNGPAPDPYPEEPEYGAHVHDPVPIWKQLLNFVSMSISVVILPWIIYLLIICFLLTHLLNFGNILPVDLFFGYTEILLASAVSLAFGMFWNTLSIFACRMWIRRIVLPLIYLCMLVSLSAVVVFLLIAFAVQMTAKFVWGIVLLYIIVLVLIIPVWILRFIKQEYMIRYFAKRIIIYLWNHKIAIPLVILAGLLQTFICLLIFVFNGYWYVTIPLGLFAMDIIRNSLLYAICRMDRHFIEEGKSNATLSVSYFLEAIVIKLLWIALGTLLSILQPIVAALRSVSLAIITVCISYNYLVLFLVKTIQNGGGVNNEEEKNKKAIVLMVVGIIAGPAALFLLIVSYIMIVVSVVFYVICEFLLIFMSRGVIASMGFFQENWFQAIFRQIRTRLNGGFFTEYPLSKADTLYEKVRCIVYKLIANIAEVSEQNNVLLYFSEMGSIISASIAGIIAYWWIGKLVPTDEANADIRNNFYPYYQGILVCLVLGYVITGTILQLVEAHVHTLCLCMKYRNLSLLSKFTKMDVRKLQGKSKRKKKKKNTEETADEAQI